MEALWCSLFLRSLFYFVAIRNVTRVCSGLRAMRGIYNVYMFKYLSAMLLGYNIQLYHALACDGLDRRDLYAAAGKPSTECSVIFVMLTRIHRVMHTVLRCFLCALHAHREACRY
jgi:hypothetical protein